MEFFQEKHNIIIPDDNQPIARYFTGEKLHSILASNELWFSNADKFSDNNERKIPDNFFKNWLEESKNGYLRIKTAKDEVIKAYVSCWTEFDSENYALWRIYDKNSNGVCLITTVGKLRKAINRNDMFICKVQYYDNEDKNKIYIPWHMYKDKIVMRVTESYKIKPYKYEQEIRSIIYKNEDIAGFSVKVNFSEFVDKIIISPFANKDTVSDIKKQLLAVFSPDIICDSIINEDE